MIAYDLTPVTKRPYAGSSPNNSMLDLAVGHNGVGRFVRLWQTQPTDQATAPRPVTPAGPPAGGEGYARLFVRTPVGPLRLLGGMLAAQAMWLLPLTLAGAVALARGGVRPPLDPSRLVCLLWTGWALTYAAVYSYAGGIFHFYYLTTLGPPLAAIAAGGTADLWRRYRAGGAPGVLIAGALLLTAMWQCYVHAMALPGVADDWQRRLSIWVLAGAAASALALITRLIRRGESGSARWPAAALALGLTALLLMPTAWSLSSVRAKGVPVIPSADIGRLRARWLAEPLARWRMEEAADRQALIAFLQANRQGERFLLATPSAQLASPLIIATGAPVMAMGGFHGLDPILTPERLAALVEARAVRFVMLGDLSIASRYVGAESAGRPLADWVRAHGQPVDTSVWGGSVAGRGARRQLYDLKPEAGLAPASEKGRS
jgi:4-amino-4-deoxy-L-arabinose transferase-like glycosyltransferase